MTDDPGALTLEDLDRFLGTSEQPADLIAYLDAAAVLAAFDPLQLQPVGGPRHTASGSVLEGILPVCEQLTQPAVSGQWTLKLTTRRESLHRLVATDRIDEALAANPDRPDVATQRMFERIVEDRSIALDECSRSELAALLTVHDWLDGILDGLPDASTIRSAITRSDLLAPMRTLVEHGFVGRAEQLLRLGEHLYSDARTPLFVFGPGGMGKSTLLAAFTLQQVVPMSFPLAYVDLDRPTIRPDAPSTVLLDLLAQLEPQIDLTPEAAEALAAELTFSIRRKDFERGYESADAGTTAAETFCRMVGQSMRAESVLIIIDTFEEAQFLGGDVVWSLVQTLLSVSNLEPRFRLVLAGRALPDEFLDLAFDLDVRESEHSADELADVLESIPALLRPINLGVLDQAAARELLRGAASPASDALGDDDLDEVIGVVTRNPMCLKLAGRLLREEGVDKLIGSRTEFLALLRAEKIQAMLYGRILRHVHDDDARAIAYPGLVVRRITPEVIRDVLAGPCALQLTPERDEWAVFLSLSNEAALLEVDPADGSLRHRTDVRRAMLADLVDEIPENTVVTIDRQAVAFYARHDDIVSRAEELYHRLRLGDDPGTLEARWLPGVGTRLKSAIEELPAQQRLWLAGKLGITLDESIRRDADQEIWEEQAVRSVQRFLSAGAAPEALKVLRERPERLPRSPLFALESDVLRLAGRPGEAVSVARAGADSAIAAGAIDMALELLLHVVVIDEGRGDLDAALAALDEARAVADHSSNAVLRFRVTVTGLRLHRERYPEDVDEEAELAQVAAAELSDEVLTALQVRPVLLREAAAELAADDARLASMAIETLGVEISTEAQVSAFGEALTSLDAELGAEALGKSYEKLIGPLQEDDVDIDSVRRIVNEELTTRKTRALARTLAPGLAASTLTAFRSYFRAGVAAVGQGDIGPL